MARIENVNIDGTDYDVGKIASTSDLGVVQVGSGLTISSGGVLSATGGGGAGAFQITATSIDFTNASFTADKTFDEIKTAYEAGNTLVLKATIDNYEWNIPLADVYDNGSNYYFDFVLSDAFSSGADQYSVVSLNNVRYMFSVDRFGAQAPYTYEFYCEDRNNSIAVTSSLSSRPVYPYIVPSGQCVYDIIGNIETILQTLNSGNGAQ